MGLFGRKKKAKHQPTTINSTASGAPVWKLDSKIIEKDNKEWFEADKRYYSTSREYALCDGFDRTGNEALALISRTEGLRLKRFEEGIEAVIVFDSGKAYVLSSEGNLHMLSKEATSKKKMTAEDLDFDSFILDSQGCYCVSDDCLDTIYIYGFIFETSKGWTKKLKYTGDSELLESKIVLKDNDSLEVTSTDGTSWILGRDGKIIM